MHLTLGLEMSLGCKVLLRETLDLISSTAETDVVAHTCNLPAEEVAKGERDIHVLPQLHRELKASP